MPEDDERYRFIFDTVSKYAPTDPQWDTFKTSTELAQFCDDSATMLLSCVFSKEGLRKCLIPACEDLATVNL